ncbi:MAG: hypothetical protein P1U70_20110 [Saprospiraceae bacterium]|nr:hypothetical protein [Saprospiraceae bacterium]
MENKIVDKVSRSFSLELPARETLDDYLDLVLPEVRQWGEDLNEKEHYVSKGGKPWQEIRDDEGFHEAVLHFFNDGGEYLESVDGNISKGRWRLLDGSNKMILERGNRSELYELAFLSSAFFILKKHGNNRGRNKYFVMGYEPYMRGLEWRDYVELLFNTYRSQQTTYKTLAIVLLILLTIIILFSIF